MKRINENMSKIRSLIRVLLERVEPKDWQQGKYYTSIDGGETADTPSTIVFIEKREGDNFTIKFIDFNEETQVRTEEDEFSVSSVGELSSLEYLESTKEKWQEILEYDILDGGGSKEEKKTETQVKAPKIYHTDTIKSEFDDKTETWTVEFIDGSKYIGELDSKKQIFGEGTFRFKNGNTIKGTFKTAPTESGITYSVTLKNNKTLGNIFDYSEFKNIYNVRTLGGIESGVSSDKNYCKKLKNFYFDYFEDIKDGYIINNELQLMGSDLENKKTNIKECYNNFTNLFSQDEIAQLQNLGGEYDQYRIDLIESFYSIIKKVVLEANEKKQKNLIETKIIENRFNYILNEKSLFSIKNLIKEKNNLLNSGYNKELVNDIYNKKKTSGRRRL
jgi:hypothetical protein